MKQLSRHTETLFDYRKLETLHEWVDFSSLQRAFCSKMLLTLCKLRLISYMYATSKYTIKCQVVINSEKFSIALSTFNCASNTWIFSELPKMIHDFRKRSWILYGCLLRKCGDAHRFGKVTLRESIFGAMGAFQCEKRFIASISCSTNTLCSFGPMCCYTSN